MRSPEALARDREKAAARMRRRRERTALRRRRAAAVRDPLLVTCWCESETVEVSTEDVRRGLTGSCGRKRCQAAA